MSFAWRFEIEDALSERALRMDQALSKLEATSRRMESALLGVNKNTKDVATSHDLWFSKLDHGINLAKELTSTLFEMGKGLFEVGKGFAEAALEAASFHEGAVIGLTSVMGDKGVAQNALANVVQMAGRMPITTEDALNASRQLLMTGFSEAQNRVLLMGMSDVGALNGGGERGQFAQQMFIRQIKDIQSIGMNSRHLMALSMETALPEGQILDQIGKLQGWKGMDHEQMKRRLHEVSSDTGITAVLRTIASKEGGTLGNISGEMGKTVSGLYTTLKSRKLEMFMNLDASTGYEKYKGFLQNLVNLSDSESGFGKTLRSTITKTFDNIFGAAFGELGAADGADKMEALLNRLLAAGSGFMDGMTMGLRTLFGDGSDVFKTGPLSPGELDKIKWKFEDWGLNVAASIHLVTSAFDALYEAGKSTATFVDHVMHPLSSKNDDGTDPGLAQLLPGQMKGEPSTQVGLTDVLRHMLNPEAPSPIAQRATIHVEHLHVDASGHEDSQHAAEAASTHLFSEFEKMGLSTGGL